MSETLVRLLTFSTLYPNAMQPNHGVFVENRLRHLVGSSRVAGTVLAPVPWFPSAAPRFGAWARYAEVSRAERRHGLWVHHPRYVVVPRVGMSLAPLSLRAAAARALDRLRAEGLRFDVIDAHYVYPDGVAAAGLAQRYRVPVVITARGSDITQLADYRVPRRMIRWAIDRADALVAVSAALAERLVELGAAPDKVRVLRNGVDTNLFRPSDRAAARAALGLRAATLLSVGHLIERKGHHRAIAALTHLPDAELLIVGEGPLRQALQDEAERLGVAGRVRFLGSRPHAELPEIYAAADLLVLASSREGWANVLLEAMACGTPVVASPIPGNPEVVRVREAGLIAAENTPAGLAEAARDLLDNSPERADTRAYAERFGWEETSAGQREVFACVLGRSVAPSNASDPSHSVACAAHMAA